MLSSNSCTWTVKYTCISIFQFQSIYCSYFAAVVKINFDWAKWIAIRSFGGFCLKDIQSWNVPVSFVWWFSVWRHINNYITSYQNKKTFKKQVTQSNLNQIFAQVPVFIFYDAISRSILKLDYTEIDIKNELKS